jgi:hypothetical protein
MESPGGLPALQNSFWDSAGKDPNVWRWFSFGFWMPSGRMVHIDPLVLPAGRPCDDGHTPPPPGEYMVIAAQVARAGGSYHRQSLIQLGNVLKFMQPKDGDISLKNHQLRIVTRLTMAI